MEQTKIGLLEEEFAAHGLTLVEQHLVLGVLVGRLAAGMDALEWREIVQSEVERQAAHRG